MVTTDVKLPAAADQFLLSAGELLRKGKIDRLRFYSLILHVPLTTMISRRKQLFDVATFEERDYGYEVFFRRHMKRSKNNPEGRDCEGIFNLLAISNHLVIVVSALSRDDNLNGPVRFVEKAYPLAKRPFLPSSTLIRLIGQFADEHTYTATSLDAIGKHRQSRSVRREWERQPPADLAREMAEQGRLVHGMLVSFRSRVREVARLSLDRSASLTLHTGDPTVALCELLLPGIAEATATDQTYEVDRAAEPTDQESVEIDFADEPFDSYDSMHALCDAVRRGDGLNVAVIHLNPYLHAQVLDFFTGEAVEMLVTDNRSVSLVPRSSNCGGAIQRIATTIFRHFGEGKPKRTRLAESA